MGFFDVPDNSEWPPPGRTYVVARYDVMQIVGQTAGDRASLIRTATLLQAGRKNYESRNSGRVMFFIDESLLPSHCQSDLRIVKSVSP
jgi:hypothetical protein